MKYVWPILALFSARFFSTAWFFPEGDGDLGWQRWLGGVILTTGRLPRTIGAETFSAPGAPWVPQEWLFSIFACLSTGFWWYVFAATCAVAAMVSLFFGAMRAKRSGATSIAIAVTLVFAGVSLFESFGIRVQVYGWPFLAAFLWFLEADSVVAYWAVAVVALWSNVHASVMLAPPLAAVIGLGNFFDEGLTVRTKRLCVIACASIVATCANPLGWALPRYAVMLFSSPFKTMITEWKHTDFGDTSFIFGVLPLLLLIMAFGIRGSGQWKDRFLLVTVCLLMFSAARNVPVFAIACFPVIARSLSLGSRFFGRADREPTTATEKRLAALTPVVSGILAVVVGAGLIVDSRTDAVSADNLKPALRAIESLPGQHNVFCADFAWCSFLIPTGRDRIFLDGRADPYPMDVWDDFGTITRVKPRWDKTLHARKVNVVLVGVKSSLEQVLELSPDWGSVYRNNEFRVWVVKPSS